MRSASAVTTGASISVPSKDQVPELRKAVPSRAEMAATAEPVSWDAGTITGVPESAVVPATLESNGPITDPGSTIRAGSSAGKSKRFSKSVAQVRFTGLTIWVVVAFVNSQTAIPVSQ